MIKPIMVHYRSHFQTAIMHIFREKYFSKFNAIINQFLAVHCPFKNNAKDHHVFEKTTAAIGQSHGCLSSPEK